MKTKSYFEVELSIDEVKEILCDYVNEYTGYNAVISDVTVNHDGSAIIANTTISKEDTK